MNTVSAILISKRFIRKPIYKKAKAPVQSQCRWL